MNIDAFISSRYLVNLLICPVSSGYACYCAYWTFKWEIEEMKDTHLLTIHDKQLSPAWLIDGFFRSFCVDSCRVVTCFSFHSTTLVSERMEKLLFHLLKQNLSPQCWFNKKQSWTWSERKTNCTLMPTFKLKYQSMSHAYNAIILTEWVLIFLVSSIFFVFEFKFF